MTFFTKKFITFSKVTAPYKYHFRVLKGLQLRWNMPGVFLTPVCRRRVEGESNLNEGGPGLKSFYLIQNKKMRLTLINRW